MATLYIRDWPDELQRRVRVCAAMSDETHKALIERAVQRECERIEREHGR